MKTPLFPTGQIVSTPGAIAAMAEAGISGLALLKRHVNGDWGDVCDEDKAMNDNDLTAGNRLLSAYTVAPNVKVWIITERDRSVTTFLLPDEY